MKASSVGSAMALILICLTANAEDLFQSCDTLASDKRYHLLFEYFAESGTVGSQCQRLNDHEFLYTSDEHFFLCSSDTKTSLACDSQDGAEVYRGLELVERFHGAHGRQFVLFKTSGLRMGIFGQAYLVFFLVPKSVEPNGYRVFDLPSTQGSYTYGGEDGSVGCRPDIYDNADENYIFRDPRLADMTTEADPAYEFILGKSDEMVIRFNQKITHCKTKSHSRKTVEYTWVRDGFKQTKKEIDDLPD